MAPSKYTYKVTATGNVPLSDVSVSDDKCSPVTYVSGDANSDEFLDLSEEWTFTCMATVTVDTTNTGTATGHDGEDTVTDTDQATVTIVFVNPQANTPDIHLEKTVAPFKSAGHRWQGHLHLCRQQLGRRAADQRCRHGRQRNAGRRLR